MANTMGELMTAVLIGLGATALMDLWAVILRSVFQIPAANYCLVGRWFRYMPAGTFKHVQISSSASKPGECLVGWTAHYCIGVFYALVLVSALPGWMHAPTVVAALLVGLLTLVFPFAVMQPAFGLGFAASRTSHPAQARLRSIMAHTVFGFGLYGSALLVNFIA